MSLRDVERAMIVFEYFYEKIDNFKEADKEQAVCHSKDVAMV